MGRKSYTKIYTPTHLVFMNSQGQIDLRPDYQRNAVWGLYNKQLLIDSIIIGIPIPKLFFHKPSGSNNWEVVDGQQRLRAIFEFMDNQYPLGRQTDDFSGLKFKELPSDVQHEISAYNIEVQELEDWTNEEIEDMFLRLQEGSALKAPEKRRAIAGNCRIVIKNLASHQVYTLVEFDNVRYGWEDVAAKALIQHFHSEGNYQGRYTSISASALEKFYTDNVDLNENNQFVQRLKKSMKIIKDGFHFIDTNPRLKRWSFVTLTNVVSHLDVEYNLSTCAADLARSFLDFEARRIANNRLSEDEADVMLVRFSEYCRNDQTASMEYRHKELYNEFLRSIPELTPRNIDPQRQFSNEQRLAIWHLSDKTCSACGIQLTQDNFDADHIVRHSESGPTTVANGRVMCPSCNRSNRYN